MTCLEELFCHVDDFCQSSEPLWQRQLLSNGLKKRQRKRSLTLSEIMTILIAFHQSHYRNFKHDYLNHVHQYWSQAFPGLVSYTRSVDWTPSCLFPLCCYLKQCFGHCTGINFIDATSLNVCHNRRINQHKVFKNLAARGKTS
ncbi:MAG: transposase, partial [Cyanobacteria bacterium J06626_14]